MGGNVLEGLEQVSVRLDEVVLGEETYGSSALLICKRVLAASFS